ncbi:MAG: hypothetical protein RBT04_01015 [Sphaerochaetaceae bacterium]|jgi:hypothetical protein|nr:hypothetical protein [Sphaerochaetaceae bacterium]
MKKLSFSRRHLFQLAAIVVMIALAVIMYIIGRQHTVLLDNKTIEHEGKSYPAFSIVEVEVNKEGKIELAARDRDKADVMGQRHKITVTYTDKFFEEHEVVKKFKVPIGYDMVLISIPALVADLGQSIWLQQFIPPTAAVAPVVEELPVEDDLGIDLGEF